MKSLLKNPKTARIVAVAAAIVLMIAVVGSVWARYVREESFSGNVQFSASLASELTLFEHRAVQNGLTGAYTLGAEIVSANSYRLIPGFDVPKDPTVRVVGKTGIDAFLFVEAVGVPAGITFSVTSDWMPLTVAGRQVWVFKGSTAAPVILDESFGAAAKEIPVLEGNLLRVSQSIQSTAVQTLAFRAYLLQVPAGTAQSAEGAQAVFTTAV